MTPSFGSLGGMRPDKGTLKRGGSTGDMIPKGYRKGQIQQFTPEQMDLFSQLFGHLGPDSFLSQLAGGDESQFEQMEVPAHRMFQGQLGQLASRFSGMGSGGRHGSGFQNSATAAASNFSQDLASNRQNLQRQALNDLMGLSNTLLNQRPQEKFLSQKQQKPDFWGQLIGGLAGQVPGAIASYATGGFSGLGNLFGGSSQGSKPGYNFLNEMKSGSGYNY